MDFRDLHAMIPFQSLQHLRCPPFRRIHILVRAHTLVRAVKTTEVCANVTQSHTVLSVPALRVRKGRGLRASMLYDSLAPWTPKAVECNQIPYVDHQLHFRCSRWNVGYTPRLQLFRAQYHPSASLNPSQWGREYQTGHFSTQLTR